MMINRLLMAVVLFSSTAFSQGKEGKVIYERKINLHKDLPPEAEQFKAMTPEFQVTKMELLFNNSQSLFHALPGDEEDQMPQPGGEGGRRMTFRFGGPDAETFRNYETELSVESRELGPRKYIIDDTLRPLKWKLEPDTLTILGHLCHKAVSTQPAPAMRMRRQPAAGDTASRESSVAPKEQQLVAWYTEAIDTQAGPDSYFGLPGLILKTDLNNGSVVYTALSLETLEKATVKAPANGKKITRDEYRKMMADQMQSMRGGPGGGAQVIRVVQ